MAQGGAPGRDVQRRRLPALLMELHVSLTAAVPNGAWVEYIPQLDAITTSRMAIATATRSRPTRRPRHRLGLRRHRAPRRGARATRRPARSRRSRPCSPAASLTIRLHPNDDVVIARAQLVGGTQLLDEKITSPASSRRATRSPRARSPSGEPVKRYNQIIGFASARHRARRARAPATTWRWATFDRDYAFGADAKPTQYVAPPATFMGIVARRRAASPRATTSASCRR